MLEFATVGGHKLQRGPLIGEVADLGPAPGPCAVGGPFTVLPSADEWDRYVAGDRPLRSACA